MLFAALALIAAQTAPELTDAQILAFAASPYNKSEKSMLRELLGYHHGVRVIADYPCSDLCPDYTIRLIYYDVPVGPSACDPIGGVIRKLTVPAGIGMDRRYFCVPGVLGDPAVYDPQPW